MIYMQDLIFQILRLPWWGLFRAIIPVATVCIRDQMTSGGEGLLQYLGSRGGIQDV